MKMIEKNMILPHDLELLGSSIGDIVKLIQISPFSERINFLLQNRDIATIPVRNSLDQMLPPNCIGTTLYIAGVSDLPYPYHGYDFELNSHMKSDSNSLFEMFNPHIERRVPGAFVFSYCCDADWHAGIYLGIIKNTPIFFTQHGPGLEFGPESINCYSDPEYFIPKTLK